MTGPEVYRSLCFHWQCVLQESQTSDNRDNPGGWFQWWPWVTLSIGWEEGSRSHGITNMRGISMFKVKWGYELYIYNVSVLHFV